MAYKNLLLFFTTSLLFSSCLGITTTATKRQANNVANVGSDFKVPARDLLPPPALSASFPTLRPNSGGRHGQSPHINLIPPFQQPGVGVGGGGNNGQRVPTNQPTPPGSPSSSSSSSSNTKSEPALLPPIEIPPARPLTDAEIAELSFVESSFVPTTGQGVGAPSGNKENVKASTAPVVAAAEVQLPVKPTETKIPPAIIKNTITNTNGGRNINSTSGLPSNVKFPDAGPSLGPGQLCPVCECTPEVDYICGSNGVIYLNSCSFDCATFCEAGLRKVRLEFCALPNSL